MPLSSGLSIHDDTKHKGSAKRGAANGVASLDASVKIDVAHLPFPLLTVPVFQTYPATGTVPHPEEINDNSLVTGEQFDVVDEYVEVQFGHQYLVLEYRIYGHDMNNQDGAFKIQYYQEGAWIDDTLNIPTSLGAWTAWAPLSSLIWTSAIRIVATTIDSEFGGGILMELEMRG